MKEPILSEKVIESERGSIVSEYNQKYSKYQQKVYRNFYSLLCSGTEYQYPGLGTLESINSNTTEDIKNWYISYSSTEKIELINIAE